MTSDSRVDEQAAIPVSALNQYAYCPRRCFLIHVEGEFKDNAHTILGTAEHRVADTSTYEKKAEIKVEYALPIWNRELGLTGKCDVVEYSAHGKVYPVEFKHGKRQRWVNDDLQLAAQAICLEEMAGIPVPLGAIYHVSSRRRREVSITSELRQQVRDAVTEIRELFGSRVLPPPIDDERKCGECSLREICQPELGRANRKIAAQAANLFVPEDESI